VLGAILVPMTLRDYRDLDAWQQAMNLAEVSYRLCAQLPTFERYGLAQQIRRAATSIPANLAEGNSRAHRAEYLHFVAIARGSAAELRTHVELSRRLGLLPEAECMEALRLADRVCEIVAGLQRSLRKGFPGRRR